MSKADWEEHPLFATAVPEKLNPEFAALQNLLYDDSAAAVAENFRLQGNEAFRKGPRGHADALSFYQKGLEVPDVPPPLAALLFSNIASVHLKRDNNRAALEAAERALALDEAAAKAWYKKARALLALDRLDDAMETVDAAKQRFAAEAEFVALGGEIQQRIDARARQRAADERVAAGRVQYARQLMATLSAKKIAVADPFAASASTPWGAAVLLVQQNVVLCSVVVDFADERISEFLGRVGENETVQDVLETLLRPPPPWATAPYDLGSVSCSVLTPTGPVVLERGVDTTLLEAWRTPGFLLSVPFHLVVQRV